MQFYDRITLFFTNNFEKQIEILQNASYYIFSLLYFIVISLSTPFLLVAIAVVEYNRVNYGLSVSNNSLFSALMSATLVVSVIIIEMLIIYIENKHDIPNYKINWKHLKKSFVSWFIDEPALINENELSVKRFKRVRFFVLVGIVLSSSAGVLENTVANDPILADTLWHRVPSYIIQNSNIVEFIKYLDIFFLTLVFIFLAQRFSEHSSKQYFEAISVFRSKRQEIELDGKLTVAQYVAKNTVMDFNRITFLDKENDLVDIEAGRIYDSQRDLWSKEYKANATIINNLYKLSEYRQNLQKVNLA